MRKSIIISLSAALFVAYSANLAYSEVNVGISADRDGIKEFYLSVGTHYGAREADIEKVRARSLPDDEMAVVFFLSNRLQISPVFLVDLRLSGRSWLDITLKYGLSPEIYYVKFASDPGPPYGKAWGHYKHTPKKKWHQIQLADADIVNLVNLKFFMEQYQCSPEQVVRMKKQGKSFAKMNGEFKKAKAEKKQKEASAKKTSAKKGNKGKGKK